VSEAQQRKLAFALADRPYNHRVWSEETTEGRPIYVARTLELEGCLAQGRTREEALANLLDARTEYIYSLLVDGLPVPPPLNMNETHTTASSIKSIALGFPDEMATTERDEGRKVLRI